MANSDPTGEAFAYRIGYERNGNMFTTGQEAFSYAECIARWTDRGAEVNENSYSVTTKRHQNSVIRALKARGFTPDPEQPDDLDDGWVLYTHRPIWG